MIWYSLCNWAAPNDGYQPINSNQFCIFTTAESRAKIWPVKLNRTSPRLLRLLSVQRRCSAVLYSLCIFGPIVCVWSLFCFAVPYFVSFLVFSITLLGKRADCSAFVVFWMSCRCYYIVLYLFLGLPLIGLWCVILWHFLVILTYILSYRVKTMFLTDGQTEDLGKNNMSTKP